MELYCILIVHHFVRSYRVPPSDISYYSDADIDERIQNRSRSQPGTYAIYSPPDVKGKDALFV